eukprot:1263472-Pleurochrysis_carterae.AAC.1
MVSHCIPDWVRKASMPSGRWKGPEKRSRTRRERKAAPITWSAERTSWGVLADPSPQRVREEQMEAL